VGTDPARFTDIDGKDLGTIQGVILALSRLAVGTATVGSEGGPIGNTVTFPADRFTEPPIVILQHEANTAPGTDAVYFAKAVTKDDFVVGTGQSTNPAGQSIYWLAMQPPFGLERQPEDVD